MKDLIIDKREQDRRSNRLYSLVQPLYDILPNTKSTGYACDFRSDRGSVVGVVSKNRGVVFFRAPIQGFLYPPLPCNKAEAIT